MLNPSGMRFGLGDIYSVLERRAFATCIDDVICVDQRRLQDKDKCVLLFIKMRAVHKPDPPFEGAIPRHYQHIAEEATRTIVLVHL